MDFDHEKLQGNSKDYFFILKTNLKDWRSNGYRVRWMDWQIDKHPITMESIKIEGLTDLSITNHSQLGFSIKLLIIERELELGHGFR